MQIGSRRQAKGDPAVTDIVDIHSHILPGLDDGSRSMEQSMEMVETAHRQGIGTIIATPHFMPDSRSPLREDIEDAVYRLQEEITAAGYGIELYSGNEIYFHEEVIDLLERDRLLTLAGSDCVLIEFSPMEEVRYIRNALGQIMSLGLTPVLAHAERYENIMKQAGEQIFALKEMGVLIQVNASAVDGSFGKAAQKKVMGLLKEQLVDFIGTDAHSAVRRAPMVQDCVRMLRKKCSEGYAGMLLAGNAQRLLLQ